jgi:hypothetical protein
MYPYQIQGNRITIVVKNQPYTLAEGQLGYAQLREAIKNREWDLIPGLVSPKEVIVSYTNGSNIKIIDNDVWYKNTIMGDGISKRILSMFEEGFDITPMTNFLENVMLNPSAESRQELFEFLDQNDLPITPDGDFLAYKKVRLDYMDVHSGTISNKVGENPKMDRVHVDADRRNECSNGLHFCSYTYLSNFSGRRVMILKINPKNVVSIPNDYNRAKGRCSEYVVVGEVDVESAQKSDILTSSSVVDPEEIVKLSSDGLETLGEYRLYQVAERLGAIDNLIAPNSSRRLRNKKAAIGILRAKYSTLEILDQINSL